MIFLAILSKKRIFSRPVTGHIQKILRFVWNNQSDISWIIFTMSFFLRFKVCTRRQNWYSLNYTILKNWTHAGHWWLTPLILATQEAAIRRTEVQSQPGQNSLQDPISKIPNNKKRASGVAWLQWYSTCLARVRLWVQTPVLPKNKKKKTTPGSCFD
jgi:hypothetical protein